ncbi:cytidylyltransferase domain-containing protein [Mediterraneibacter glycyrrhizinilyticus]|uniref:cytidylyltransferase domain-containing protein n=1 Tax=Mediterraneibacter glycyrrhizinilyticus TaxID=342942 RepID=UPI0025A43E05|nr:hypothetical protein [Mediterraneibacter glycyrrhizinilyticus]MDM8209877.1 hypothetical protein [Mediterraneibacter glycyrrhizinilyticus]
MKKDIAVISSRYNPSRFPGKSLANVCGKPMTWWACQQVNKVKEEKLLGQVQENKK